MGYTPKPDPAPHPCWDRPGWDGLLAEDCPGCAEAEANPCTFCGYGHAFTTHNPEPHYDGGDALAPPEDALTEAWLNAPHLTEGT